MVLTEIEKQITQAVLRRFLEKHESMPERPLLKEFRDPDALPKSVESNVLETDNYQSSYLPKALAFQLCADAETLLMAKESVSMIAHVLQNLFDEEPEQIQFPCHVIEQRARKLYKDLDSRKVELGLYLVREFPEIVCGRSPDASRTKVNSVLVNKRIVALRKFDTLWDDRMRQALPPPKEPENTERASPILLRALRVFCGDDELDELLMRAHSINPKRSKESAVFERSVGWLLSLFGLCPIVLGDYERLKGHETETQRTSVDILAASQTSNTLLLVSCTLGPPQPHDFGNLRYAYEIFAREVFRDHKVRIIPVVFSSAMGCSVCDGVNGSAIRVPIVDADQMKNLLTLVRQGQGESVLLSLLEQFLFAGQFSMGDDF